MQIIVGRAPHDWELFLKLQRCRAPPLPALPAPLTAPAAAIRRACPSLFRSCSVLTVALALALSASKTSCSVILTNAVWLLLQQQRIGSRDLTTGLPQTSPPKLVRLAHDADPGAQTGCRSNWCTASGRHASPNFRAATQSPSPRRRHHYCHILGRPVPLRETAARAGTTDDCRCVVVQITPRDRSLASGS